MQGEHWAPMPPDELPERRCLAQLPRWMRHLMGIWTLNGHLVPFSGWLWDRLVVQIEDRGLVYAVFGAAHVTYRDSTLNKGYIVQHSKARFFKICTHATATWLRFLWRYADLKRAYRQHYGTMTSQTYWEKRLSNRS